MYTFDVLKIMQHKNVSIVRTTYAYIGLKLVNNKFKSINVVFAFELICGMN